MLRLASVNSSSIAPKAMLVPVTLMEMMVNDNAANTRASQLRRGTFSRSPVVEVSEVTRLSGEVLFYDAVSPWADHTALAGDGQQVAVLRPEVDVAVTQPLTDAVDLNIGQDPWRFPQFHHPQGVVDAAGPDIG